MKNLNNKGYMLVEVILSFSITFVLIYFIMNLVIKLKMSNDDLLVETLVKTDQIIITNKLMSYAMDEKVNFNCEKLKEGITDNSVKYNNELIDIVSDYAKIDVSSVSCSTDLGKININIPINVEQMKKEDFNVIIDYKYDIGDMISPTCSLIVDDTIIKAIYSDNDNGSGIEYYGFDTNNIGINEEYREITDVGTYTFYVVDKAGNKGNCEVEVKSTTIDSQTNTYRCDDGYVKINDSYCYQLK